MLKALELEQRLVWVTARVRFHVLMQKIRAEPNQTPGGDKFPMATFLSEGFEKRVGANSIEWVLDELGFSPFEVGVHRRGWVKWQMWVTKRNEKRVLEILEMVMGKYNLKD